MTDKKLEHTPGPWKFIDVLGGCRVTGILPVGGTMHILEHYTHFRVKVWEGGTKIEKYHAGVGEHGPSILNRINNISPTKTGKANASLIAAAPEMLEALVKIVELKEKSNSDDFSWSDLCDCIHDNNIENLIEKATGKKIEEVI